VFNLVGNQPLIPLLGVLSAALATAAALVVESSLFAVLYR
jgi:O-antigen/teichoic acid export membrane protein